jgi:hypothetical protein
VKVWCVFFIDDETLAWSLDSIWVTEEKATKRALEAEDVSVSPEYRVERWLVN